MKSLSRVQLFVTPWIVTYQAPSSMGFSRQEYWSGLPFPPPQDLPEPGINPCLLHWQVDFFIFNHCATWEAHPYAHICTNKTNYLWANNIPCYDTILGKTPGRRHGSLLQYSCLENPMDRGTWWATWGHRESDTTEVTCKHDTRLWYIIETPRRQVTKIKMSKFWSCVRILCRDMNKSMLSCLSCYMTLYWFCHSYFLVHYLSMLFFILITLGDLRLKCLKTSF